MVPPLAAMALRVAVFVKKLGVDELLLPVLVGADGTTLLPPVDDMNDGLLPMMRLASSAHATEVLSKLPTSPNHIHRTHKFF